MSYRLTKNRTFTCTAALTFPTDEGPQTQTLGVRFKVVPGAENMPLEDFLRAAILHLSDIIDDEGEPVAFSSALLDQMLAEPWARVGLVKAYWTELAGSRAKKLIWAGAAWADGTLQAGRHELAEDCALFGIDPALFADGQEAEGLWPENAAVLDAFLSVTTQWRVVGTAGGPLVTVGLDYQGVKTGLELAGIAPSPELWADVQLIEAGALGVLNRRRS